MSTPYMCPRCGYASKDPKGFVVDLSTNRILECGFCYEEGRKDRIIARKTRKKKKA